MSGFLQADESGPAMDAQTWNVVSDAASVLSRLDIQLQKEFQQIDSALEENRTQGLSVAGLIDKWNAFSASMSVDGPEKMAQLEQRSQVAIEMNVLLGQQMEELRGFMLTAGLPALKSEVFSLQAEMRNLKTAMHMVLFERNPSNFGYETKNFKGAGHCHLVLSERSPSHFRNPGMMQTPLVNKTPVNGSNLRRHFEICGKRFILPGQDIEEKNTESNNMTGFQKSIH